MAPQDQSGKAAYPPGFLARCWVSVLVTPPPMRPSVQLNESNRRLEPNDSRPFQAERDKATARRRKASGSVGAGVFGDSPSPRQSYLTKIYLAKSRSAMERMERRWRCGTKRD